MSANAALVVRRTEADARFARTGVPHRRIEAWHYTDLKSRVDADLPVAGAYDGAGISAANPFAGIEADTLVFANGYYRPDLSRVTAEPAIEIAALDDAAPDWARAAFGAKAASAMADLALARMMGGVAVRVSHNFEGKRPIHLVFLGQSPSAAARHSRVVVVLGTNAALTLLESHEAEGAAGLANLGFDFRLAANSRLTHYKIAGGVSGETHVGTVMADVEAGALYDVALAAGDGALARHEIHADLTQRMARVRLTALSLLNGAQHGDVTAVVEHAVRDGRSDLVFKSVLADKARSVAQGRILVRPGADGTDSKQSTRALLLSKGAEADAKPELEIHAEDVVCGHGAAIGDLDANALFYLRARGIPEREARAMLTEAFLQEGLARLAHTPEADAMRAFVLNRLQKLEAA
ncbi:MAG: Fe-S cluster assembly protein SufD [Micropepsaceae bacterium]